MQVKPAPQQAFMNSARAAPAAADRASPVLQKNIVAMLQAASAKIAHSQPPAQQQATPASDASLEALADRLTNLAVGGDGSTAAAHAAPPQLGGSAADGHATARASAAPRHGEAAGRQPAPASWVQGDADHVAARERARAEAAAVKKRRRAEQAQGRRNKAAAAAAALATSLASIHPAEASLQGLA